jgi:hypothetical protein
MTMNWILTHTPDSRSGSVIFDVFPSLSPTHVTQAVVQIFVNPSSRTRTHPAYWYLRGRFTYPGLNGYSIYQPSLQGCILYDPSSTLLPPHSADNAPLRTFVYA